MRAFLRRNRFFIGAVIFLLSIKAFWVIWALWGNGKPETERDDLLRRRSFLIDNIAVEPSKLLCKMPDGIGVQFRGEWALYSCSMLAEALSNISKLYPESQNETLTAIDRLIQTAKSPELRYYDTMRWGEDPLESLDGNKSHISYLSHLAWMIGNYKLAGGDGKYDTLYDSICTAMNRRILASPLMNLPTYPGEPVYVPDMLVAIVALSDYSQLYESDFSLTVDSWLKRASGEWIDEKTGLLKSILNEEGLTSPPVKGSYAALNCYYLTKIDPEFAKVQYLRLKSNYRQSLPLAGIKEYADSSCYFGLDIDAGPIILNLSPSGTAFAVGSATFFKDSDFRKELLTTAEIAGHTVQWNHRRHYLLADIALVGEAITLAMRTNHQPEF